LTSRNISEKKIDTWENIHKKKTNSKQNENTKKEEKERLIIEKV